MSHFAPADPMPPIGLKAPLPLIGSMVSLTPNGVIGEGNACSLD